MFFRNAPLRPIGSRSRLNCSRRARTVLREQLVGGFLKIELVILRPVGAGDFSWGAHALRLRAMVPSPSRTFLFPRHGTPERQTKLHPFGEALRIPQSRDEARPLPQND